MEDEIEIYVRHSAGRALLNLNVPAHLKEQFISSIRNGSLENENIQMNLELSVLPEWITENELRRKVAALNEEIHIRVPITALNVNFSD